MCIIPWDRYIVETVTLNYSLPIKYLLMMTFMLLGSGLWSFALHTSMSIEGIADYYAPKSAFGMLETVTPHLFGMGTLVFILTHFFAIVKGLDQKRYRSFSVMFFVAMLLTNFSGFFITAESIWFAWIKLITTLLFCIYTIIAMQKLLRLT